MPIFKRTDGKLVTPVPAMRKMMPHLMPGRNEAAVYFEHVLDLSKTLPYLERLNAGCEVKTFSLFHLVLCAMARTFALRPQLNRFVVGRRIYQRNDIQFSFAIKREFSDEGGMTTTKLTFAEKETLRSVAEKVKNDVGSGRKGDKNHADKELDVLTKLPRSGLRFLMWLQKALDYVNLLPSFMIKPDPLYCSMFFTNLGSVGLDSAYHHLYEYGNCPFFAALGKVKQAVVVGEDGQPAVREVVSMKFAFDERTTDGLYCAKSLEIFKRLVENPEDLEGATAVSG